MKTKLPKSPSTNHQSLSSRGFTLIELLVVIGVLGVLATMLTATIDPIEQFRKAQDSNVKNASIEYLNALVRYFATFGKYPWTTGSGVTNCDGTNISAGVQIYNSDAMKACTAALITNKELKSGFTSDEGRINEIYVSQATDGDPTVCYKPDSRSEQSNTNTKYTQSGSSGANCGGSHVSGKIDCFWCAK